MVQTAYQAPTSPSPDNPAGTVRSAAAGLGAAYAAVAETHSAVVFFAGDRAYKLSVWSSCSGAAAAQARGEHEVGCGIGAGCSSRGKPQRSSGRCADASGVLPTGPLGLYVFGVTATAANWLPEQVPGVVTMVRTGTAGGPGVPGPSPLGSRAAAG